MTEKRIIKEVEIEMQKHIDFDTEKYINICLKLAIKKAKQEFVDDIVEIFQLNNNKAIKIYSDCNCCSRFVKKILKLKKIHNIK